ncbi:MAG: glycosyltransferase family 9 protein, partial [Candidatus Omnitrophota bacterium]
NWDPKRWSADNFAVLGDRLARNLGMGIVITGAGRDMILGDTIAMKMQARPLVLCGRTTLKQLGAIFEKAKLVVANDSGPMHIAVALKANTIALFGPTSPDITGPIGSGRHIVMKKEIDCQIPCYDMSCGYNRCMDLITVDEVMEKAKEMLS